MSTNNFYCKKVCVDPEFDIDEWNKAFDYCNKAGIEGIERDKILSPELFPCQSQCFDCLAEVGAQRLKTQKLIEKMKSNNNLNTI